MDIPKVCRFALKYLGMKRSKDFRTIRFHRNGLVPFIILSSVFFLALLLSCTKSVNPNTIRFSHFWTEPGQRAVLDLVLTDFKKENPSITVEVMDLSWADGKTKLMINFNSRTAPDVLELGSDWIAQFSSSNVLEDLTANDSLQPRFANSPKYANEPGIWKGKYYAVPWFIDTRVLYINRDLVGADAHADLDSKDLNLHDWASVLQAGRKISQTGVGYGIGVNGSDVHRLYKKILPVIWSNGGEIFDAAVRPTFATKENIEALGFYVQQLEVGVLESQKNLDDLFKRGKIGILFSGAWLLKPLEKADFRWDCIPFPGNNNHPGVSFAGGEYLAVNSASAEKSAALKLVTFLTRPDIELRLSKAFNIFPADIKLQQDSFYVRRNQGSVFSEQLTHARMTPVHPKWLEIETILEDETAQALYHKKSPEEALNSCDIRVKQLLSEP